MHLDFDTIMTKRGCRDIAQESHFEWQDYTAFERIRFPHNRRRRRCYADWQQEEEEEEETNAAAALTERERRERFSHRVESVDKPLPRHNETEPGSSCDSTISSSLSKLSCNAAPYQNFGRS
jgi:hypothetical protein